MDIKLPQGGTPLEDLLLRISWQVEDKHEAQKAFAELYNRYSRYVGYICSTCTVNKNTDFEMHKIMVNKVFIKVFLNAEKLLNFKKGSEEKEKDLMFKAWLGRAATWEFTSILRDKKKGEIIVDFSTGEKKPPVFVSYEEIMMQAESCEETEPFVSKERAQLDLAWAQMPEKNRDITLTYLQLEDERGRIPTDISKNLAKLHGVLPETLNKIKTRTIEGLIKKLNPERANVFK
ncbi:MAG: hypothetical protein RBS07_16680 [Lentimicrobium sp.]|jgi:DNA-directed RNA polymerase specialized sigma24 family protein|nr:hypothetical protein [Lentimicrobium sp.]